MLAFSCSIEVLYSIVYIPLRLGHSLAICPAVKFFFHSTQCSASILFLSPSPVMSHNIRQYMSSLMCVHMRVCACRWLFSAPEGPGVIPHQVSVHPAPTHPHHPHTIIITPIPSASPPTHQHHPHPISITPIPSASPPCQGWIAWRMDVAMSTGAQPCCSSSSISASPHASLVRGCSMRK